MGRLAFGPYIRHIRKSQRKSLREAADALGITPGYLSRIETGQVPPPGGEIIQRIAAYFHLHLPDLLQRTEAKHTVDVTTADAEMGPIVATFYRMTIDHPLEIRIEMLRAALKELNLSPDQRAWWDRELTELGKLRAGGSELLRPGDDPYDSAAIPRRLTAAGIEAIAGFKLRTFYEGDLGAYVPPTPVEEIVEFSEPQIEFNLFGCEEVGGRFSDGTPAVLGRSRWLPDGRREIAVNEELFGNPRKTLRRRGHFTTAHEFFHAIEHLPRMSIAARSYALNRSSGFATLSDAFSERMAWHQRSRRRKVLVSNDDWREFQANTFAAALLMPAFSVRNLFGLLISSDPVRVPVDQVLRTADEIARRPVLIQEGEEKALIDIYDVNPQPMAIRLVTLGLVTPQ